MLTCILDTRNKIQRKGNLLPRIDYLGQCLGKRYNDSQNRFLYQETKVLFREYVRSQLSWWGKSPVDSRNLLKQPFRAVTPQQTHHISSTHPSPLPPTPPKETQIAFEGKYLRQSHSLTSPSEYLLCQEIPCMCFLN